MTVDNEPTLPGAPLFGAFTGTRPTGDVAFLFTDLQGSTQAFERDPEAMNDVLRRHDDTVRSAIAQFHGAVFSIAGDAFGASFHTMADAVGTAVTAQRGLAEQTWPSGLAPRVRMGLHFGRTFERDGNYFGPTVNRAARVMSAAHGGQVLMSDEALHALRDELPGVRVELLGHYQLKDLPEPIALHQLTIDGVPHDFPPLRATGLAARVHRPVGAFIGRDREVTRLRGLLASAPVTTVVATGGTGKTRLAYEVAATLGNEFPDGVFAVELADGSVDDVADRIADAVMGDDALARTEAATDLVAALRRHLRSHRALLVLDNCEHVLHEAGTLVAALTTGCPHLTVLATSRERLGVPGEQVLPLAPLSTATSDGTVSPAAELFMDRALSADPTTPLDPATLAAIDSICTAVDGSALAIELAASRVRTLTPQQIAHRLEHSIDVLRSRRTGGPDRHRSLEAAIAWSYELLGRDERRLLAWSSVFVGGFDLGSAATIGAAAHIDDIVGTVESLVDKSLISAQRVGDGMRYRLAEPIRQFAAIRLDESGERDRAVEAHFEHCARRAHEVVGQLDGHMNPPLFVSFSAELDNFLVAMSRATERGETSAAMVLASSLDLYWAETGHLAPALHVMDSLVRSRPDSPRAPSVYVPLLWVATMCGELPRALEVREEVSALMAEGRLTPALTGSAAFGLGFVESALGNAAGAAGAWAAAGHGAAPFAPAIARQAFWSAGQSATAAGDLDLAMSLYDAAAALAAPTPGWFPQFIEVQRLVTRAYAGEHDVERLDAGVAALEDTGLRMRFLLAAAYASLGLFEGGAPELADRWWRRAMDTGREIGNLWACWVMLECAAWSAVEHRDDRLAASLWHAVDTFGAQRGYGQWPVIEAGGTRRRDVVRKRSPNVFTATDLPSWTLAEAVEAALQSNAQAATA